MPRRIVTAREYYDMGAPWREAGNAGDLQEYRTERHRQEVALEGQTGGNKTDTEDYFARGGPPLITYKDWMRGKKIGPGEQAARAQPVTRDVYTPDPNKWGHPDDDAPKWASRHATSDEAFDRDLTRHLDEHGGATFKEHPGDGPTSGYMVSQTPDNKLPLDGYQRSVRELRDKNRGKLAPDEYNGTWKEPDAVYHEVSKNHPEYSKAQQDAYDRDQIAFRDLNNDVDIDTAATQYAGTPGIYMARRWYR